MATVPAVAARAAPAACTIAVKERRMADSDQPKPPRDEQQEETERHALMQLASVAGHQLKSPLSRIEQVISTVMGGFVGPVNERQRSMLERAARSCQEGIGLVSDLLRLRGLDEMDEQDFVSVNLVSTFRSAVERLRETATEGGVELLDRVELEDSQMGWVRGDPGLIEEILLVPLHNAIKYSAAGDTVTARLYLEGEVDPDEPEAQPTDHPELCMEVLDNGIGIPADAWEKIFEEFYRAPNAKAANREGSGLGLSFARRAARRLGGEVELEPRSAGGTRALVRIPYSPPQATELLEHGAGSGARQPEPSRRVVVIGGVVAGSKTAAKIMRLDPHAQVTIVERGRFLAYAGCGLPYYISGAVRDQRSLMSTPLGMVRDLSFFHNVKQIRVLDQTEAISVDREDHNVKVRRMTDGREWSIRYDQLVLATGAEAVVPEIQGVDLDGIYTLHGVEDAEAIRSELSSARALDVVIVGAGLLGCEIAESVALRGARLTLVERQAQILGIVDPELARLARQHFETQGVRVYTSARAAAFEGDHRVRAVRLADGRTLPCDFVILAAGVRPNSRLARECGLELNDRGAVEVDRHMRTSDPSIYAVGDCAANHHVVTGDAAWIPMGSTALKQGRVAAMNICGQETTFPGIVGSIVIRLFDYTVAKSGLRESQARQAGFDPVSVIVPGPDCDAYLPTSKPMIFKMVADRTTRRLLGAQGVGEGAVDKRIDIVATAVTAGMDLDAFAQLDLPYAPPYSLAMDTILTAANVLRNKLNGDFAGISAAELEEWMRSEGDAPFVLDVRLPAEYGTVKLPDSFHIPLGSLRGRMHELPEDRPIVAVCSIGLRSYEASLILRANGFEGVRVLDGGIRGWPYELETL
jgi:NADPH-dependent 2,4-dienoyl-CoA reductase/sulfur reductase-like enzyme/signal transduction histidine kinase/rhodanese-related sulfurtransferase